MFLSSQLAEQYIPSVDPHAGGFELYCLKILLPVVREASAVSRLFTVRRRKVVDRLHMPLR